MLSFFSIRNEDEEEDVVGEEIHGRVRTEMKPIGGGCLKPEREQAIQ